MFKYKYEKFFFAFDCMFSLVNSVFFSIQFRCFDTSV